jgi:hypothetical protein
MPANPVPNQPTPEPFEQALSALPSEKYESPFDRWMKLAEVLLKRGASPPAHRKVSN